MRPKAQEDPVGGRWLWRGAGMARIHPKCIWSSKTTLAFVSSSLPPSSLAPRSPEHSHSRREQGSKLNTLPGLGDPRPHKIRRPGTHLGPRPVRTSRGAPLCPAAATFCHPSLSEGARDPKGCMAEAARRLPVRARAGRARLRGAVHGLPGWQIWWNCWPVTNG